MIKVRTHFCTYAFLFVLLVLLTTCSTQEEPSSRSDDDEMSYWKNNTITSSILTEHMYNQDLKANNTYERFKLAHISDAHLSEWSSDNHRYRPKNLIEAVRFANQPNLRINAIVHTGDHISNSPKTLRTEAISSLSAFARFYYQNNTIPSFVCTGNHDTNMMNPDYSQMVTREDMNSLLFYRQNYPVHTEPLRNYFYADIPNPQGGMIRIISLDVTDQEDSLYDTQHLAVFTQQQIDWFCHTALKENMTDAHSVIILTHYPFAADPNQANAAAYDNCFVHAWGMIPEIVEAFRSKTSRQWTYQNKVIQDPEKNITVDVDFSQTPGEFICYLGGHIHTYASYEVGGIRNRNPELPKQRMVISNNMSPSEIGSQYNTIMRKSNSILSNSFNIYAIDTHEKKVYITFFGAYIPSSNPDFERVQFFSYL